MQHPQKYFFSYARADSQAVLKLANDLRAAGVHVWIDQLDIEGGQRWDRAVEEALKSCEGLIVALSPKAVASHSVLDEVYYALDENKPIVPVVLESCDVPFRLRRLQRVNFSTGYEQAFPRLLSALRIPATPYPIQDAGITPDAAKASGARSDMDREDDHEAGTRRSPPDTDVEATGIARSAEARPFNTQALDGALGRIGYLMSDARGRAAALVGVVVCAIAVAFYASSTPNVDSCIRYRAAKDEKTDLTEFKINNRCDVPLMVSICESPDRCHAPSVVRENSQDTRWIRVDGPVTLKTCPLDAHETQC